MTPELEPITREENFYARIAGDPGAVFEPTTREEMFLQRIIDTGGGGGGTVTVDDALSDTSENPVQNKVIAAALGNKADTTALNDYEQKPTVVTDLTSTSITLAAQDNTEYHYGELTSLTVSSFPAQGKFWIWFTSGATPTTTVGIANFTAEANKVYRIFVENGYATYDSWATT